MAASCCGGVRPARSGADVAIDNLVAYGGNTHHEELVEVRRHDRRELDPFEQRRRGIGRLLEHPFVERQPRQLAVQEPLRMTDRLIAHVTLPPRRMTSVCPKVSPNMSAREVAASSLHGQVAGALDLEDPAPLPPIGAKRRHLLQVFGVERVGHAQHRRQLVDDDAILAVERDVRQMALLRRRPAMIAGDVSRQSPSLRSRARKSAMTPAHTANVCDARAG